MMVKELEVLEKIKMAEAEAEKKVKGAQLDGARMIDAAKKEIPKIQTKAISDAEAYRIDALESAKREASRVGAELLGEGKARVKRLMTPDKETIMQIFRKAVKERFGV